MFYPDPTGQVFFYGFPSRPLPLTWGDYSPEGDRHPTDTTP